MLAIDHVIYGAADLDAAAARFERDHGLRSVVGGRHPGHGTGNRIVPLGGSYIELMAVVDATEAVGSPLGSWLGRRLDEHGDGPVALCLRTDDVDAVVRRTGHSPVAMTRTRPDGVELAWELVALDAALADGLPFFIDWHSAADHPGRTPVQHDVAITGIDWIEIGADPERLSRWLGPNDLPLRITDGRPGPQRFALATDDGGPVVIGG